MYEVLLNNLAILIVSLHLTNWSKNIFPFHAVIKTSSWKWFFFHSAFYILLPLPSLPLSMYDLWLGGSLSSSKNLFRLSKESSYLLSLLHEGRKILSPQYFEGGFWNTLLFLSNIFSFFWYWNLTLFVGLSSTCLMYKTCNQVDLHLMIRTFGRIVFLRTHTTS